MYLYKQNLSVRGNNGKVTVMPGATVHIYKRGTEQLAQLFAEDAITVLDQPLVTDSNGYFPFRAVNGEYTATFSSPRFDTFSWEIELFDADDVPKLPEAIAAMMGTQEAVVGALSIVSDELNALAGNDGAARIGFQQAANGAAQRTVGEILNFLLSKAFLTRASAQAAVIPAFADFIRTDAYASAGDGGGALYQRVALEPSHDGKLQSADGAWWELSTTQDIYPEMFGARANGVRPNSSAGMPFGVDDTAAVKSACTFLQMKAFQPNFFVGNWGGFPLHFRPNKAYVLRGHNPLGTTRNRLSDEDNSGLLQRQNWSVDGHGCLLLWIIDNEEDALIESHETLVRQHYKNFSMVPCNLTGIKGILYSNTANSGRNATMMHKFEFVQTSLVGSSANSATDGLKYLFRYSGNNLGDRLQTENCGFSQFMTAFYSENNEAVSQRFHATSFASYVDGAVFFHARRHASGFSVSECELLVKGDNSSLLKAEFMPGAATGSNLSNVIMNIERSRLEIGGGKNFTLVNAEFGMITISDVTLGPGGLPAATSNLIVVKGSAVVEVENSHLYGRVIVGATLTTGYMITRRYALALRNCMFSMDLSQSLYVEDGTGALVKYRDAAIGAYERPAVIVEDTNTRTASFQSLPTDTSRYVFDGVYMGTTWPNMNQSERTIMVGRYRTSAQFWYLDPQSYFVLPACCVITSIRLTNAPIGTSFDELRVKVGSATVTKALTSSNRNVEILGSNAVIISDDAKAERTVSLEVWKSGAVVADPSLQGFLEITYRQARGKNEITTTETAGVRLTRVV